MIYSIRNNELTLKVNSYGCEINSIKSNSSEFEYLWQGNSEIWSGQAPILFPIVGRLINDSYTLNGKEYTLQKHGFARKSEWEFLNKNDSEMTFRLSESEETLTTYPYCFDLTVKFTLDKNRLTVEHEVFNKNSNEMYFSIGAHPAFNCSIGDKLVFDKKETVSTEKIDLEKSLRLPDKHLVLNNETDIIITKDIFNEDALILSNIKSECITLKHSDESKNIRFNLGNAPYLGIWAKPGAPYVCIEPWCGVNDSTVKKDDISQKDAINKLNAGEKFTFTWWAEFSE